MVFPSQQIVNRVRAEYPVGCRVKLMHMNDPYSRLTEGSEGTVKYVDDAATIHVAWDCGSSLGIVYGEDECSVIEQ